MLAAIRQSIERNRMLVSLLTLAFFIAWFVAPHLLPKPDASPNDGSQPLSGVESLFATLWPELRLVLAVVFIAWLFGAWRSFRVTAPLNRRWLLPIVPAFLYLAFFTSLAVYALTEVGLRGTTLLGWKMLVPTLGTTLLVGIFEEFLFRGILFSAFERWRGPIVAVVVTSVLFGLMHYVNVLGGQSWQATHYQVLHAAGSGLLYAGIMLVTGTIWFAVLFHGLWDWTVFHFQTAAAIAKEAGGDNPLVQSLASSQDQAQTIGDAFTQFLTLGIEPLYGVILIAIYLRRTRRIDGAP